MAWRFAALSALLSGACTPDRGPERIVSRDPWLYPSSRPADLPEPPRCRKGMSIPECSHAPAAREMLPIDRHLLSHVGEQVTVVAKPGVGSTCSALGCPPTDRCCNDCFGPVLLCDAECTFSVFVGGCTGDSCFECCSLPVRDQRLVARGILRMTDLHPSGFVVENSTLKEVVFELEGASYSYLDDHSVFR